MPCAVLAGTAAQKGDFSAFFLLFFLCFFFFFFQKAGDQSEVEVYSMFPSFGRSESRVLQARQCFHIALGKETELSPKDQNLLSVFFHSDTWCRALRTS